MLANQKVASLIHNMDFKDEELKRIGSIEDKIFRVQTTFFDAVQYANQPQTRASATKRKKSAYRGQRE